MCGGDGDAVGAAAVLGPLPATPAAGSATWSPDLGFAAHLLDEEVVEIAARGARDLAARAGLRWRECAVALSDPQAVWEAARAGARPADPAVRPGNDAALAELFDRVDVLITPTTPGRAHGHDGPGERLSVALTWGSTCPDIPPPACPWDGRPTARRSGCSW